MARNRRFARRNAAPQSETISGISSSVAGGKDKALSSTLARPRCDHHIRNEKALQAEQFGQCGGHRCISFPLANWWTLPNLVGGQQRVDRHGLAVARTAAKRSSCVSHSIATKRAKKSPLFAKPVALHGSKSPSPLTQNRCWKSTLMLVELAIENDFRVASRTRQ